MSPDDATRASLAAFEVERPRLVGALVRMVRDVGLAEDLAQDVLLVALEEWPRGGIPASPGAWLTAAAKNRAIDALRRRRMVEQKHAALAFESEPRAPHPDAEAGEGVGDDLLRLVEDEMEVAAGPDGGKRRFTLRSVRLADWNPNASSLF